MQRRITLLGLVLGNMVKKKHDETHEKIHLITVPFTYFE